MLKGIFVILGVFVFIKILPLIITAIMAAMLIFASSEQQGNQQWQDKEYKTIKIGNQIWMSENLNYSAKGGQCYKNNPQNCVKCGRLYDWNTAKNICPKGWHLPTRNEWDALVNYMGGSNIAGKKLKAKNGFSALACGYGASDGNFYNLGNYNYWWSSSENNTNSAYFLSIDNSDNVFRNHLDKTFLFAVRCVED